MTSRRYAAEATTSLTQGGTVGARIGLVVVGIGAVTALGCSDRTTSAPSTDAGLVATSASEGGVPDAISLMPIRYDGSAGPIGGSLVASDAEACPTNSGYDSGVDSAPACDPSCQGTCIRGRCLVTLVAGQNSNVNGMAIDSTSAYWTEFPAGTVKKIPLGGGVVTTLASRQAGPLGIVAGPTSVYWTGESETGSFPNYTQTGTVTRSALDGASQATIATLQSAPDSIVVDATSVYWANGGTVLCDCGSIVRAALDGSSTATLASGRNGPSSIAVDSENVYWVENRGGTVLKVLLGGGSPTILASVPSGGQSTGTGATVAIDATNAYWTRAGQALGDGTILKVPLAGGPVTTIASGQCSPGGIAVDGTSVYWANAGGGPPSGTIVKAALDGGVVTTLASGQSYAGSVAVDSTSIYWANVVGPSIMKLTPK